MTRTTSRPWRNWMIALPLLFVASCGPPEESDEQIGQVGSYLTASSARFAVIGDYGFAGSAELAVANRVKSWTPDFIITTGDNNYPNGEQSTMDRNVGQYYRQFIYPYFGGYGAGAPDLQNHFFPTLGNHDWYATNAPTPYVNYFSLPHNERYYDVVQGPVHLFAVDSDGDEPDGNSKTSVQANWIKGRLAASTAKWKVVYFHHTPYSSAEHGSNSTMQWPFAEWGATAVLAGHDHSYERVLKSGFPYFTVGLSGYPARYTFPSIVAGSEVRFNADYGAMRVDADEDQINFKFITHLGETLDTFTVRGDSFQDGIQPTGAYAGTADAHIRQFAPTTNYGGAGTLIAGGDEPVGSGKDTYALVRFNVSHIPAGSSVSSVQLSFQVTDKTTAGQAWEIYQLKRDWVESEVTWNQYAAGKLWKKAGAADGADRGTVVLGSLSPTSTGRYTMALNATGVAVVQSWINNPATNQGLLIHDKSNKDAIGWDSREAGVAASRPMLTIAYSPSGESLLAAGSIWKYKDDGSNQGTAWRDPGFNDGGWASGPAQLGYGDGDEATVVSYGGNSSNRHITTYFRKTFNVVDPTVFNEVILRLVRDDGALVYLNGVEVHRGNMPVGAISYLTRATIAMDADNTETANENMSYRSNLSPASLVAGTNTLAVERHQQAPDSSDISFDAAVIGIR